MEVCTQMTLTNSNFNFCIPDTSQHHGDIEYILLLQQYHVGLVVVQL